MLSLHQLTAGWPRQLPMTQPPLSSGNLSLLVAATRRRARSRLAHGDRSAAFAALAVNSARADEISSRGNFGGLGKNCFGCRKPKIERAGCPQLGRIGSVRDPIRA